MTTRYELSCSLAQKAGDMARELQEQGFEVMKKGGDERNFLTSADLQLHRFITDEIKKVFPDDVIHSEEGEDNSATSFWAIDPIDGTSHFVRGVPMYSVVIGYVENSYPQCGAIYNPSTQELFHFEKGKGAWKGQLPIHISQVEHIKDSSLLLTVGRKKENLEWGMAFKRHFITHAQKNYAFGSSALDLAYCACGRVDGVVYGTMTTRDIAVAVGLLREAGGEVYTEHGGELVFDSTPQRVYATASLSLYEEIRSVTQ